MECQYGHCQNEGKYTPYLFEGKIIYCLICNEHVIFVDKYSERLRRVKWNVEIAPLKKN